MGITQRIDRCFSDEIGEGGIAREDFARLLSQTSDALQALRRAYRDGSVALLRVPEKTDDLDDCRALAEHLMDDAQALVVLGAGGASFGAQALAQASGHFPPYYAKDAGTRFYFPDNLDPLVMEAMLAGLDMRKARFLAVSKSGTTPETIAQTLAAIAAIDAAGGARHMRRHFAMVTGPGDTPLRRLAARYDIPVIDHPPDVGGRFSVLTAVGLVPAIAMGLDAKAIRQGAGAVLDQALSGSGPEDIPTAQGAALSICAAMAGLGIHVMLPYADRLERFAMWYRQLWAESLGKKGQGTTPVRALGPSDQHSQLQLYLDGPSDKLFTVLSTKPDGMGPRLSTDDEDLAYLNGRAIGDIVAAQTRATVETIARHGRPVRLIEFDTVDETSMGAILMHFMLETILAATLLGVDPYDQPAVEEAKVLTRTYLGEGGS